MQQAVFYSNIYFLIPPEYTDFESFRQAVASARKPFALKAVILREDNGIPGRNVQKGVCMAPFFLTGYHDEPSVLRIQCAEDLCPAEVEMLSQQEYNTRLRELVTEFCPGCIRFKPLSNRVQSLNGHFEEIALDGFCAYRVESKPSPRCFRDLLFSFGYFWKTFSYSEIPAEELCKHLKQMLYLRLDKPQLCEANGQKIWTSRVKTSFDAYVTEIAAHYVSTVFNPKYLIRSEYSGMDRDEDMEIHGEDSFRANCKRYGLSILTLDYDPHGAEPLKRSLSDLVEHWYLYPLNISEGHERYFALDSAMALKGLHYRLPLLRTFHASAQLNGQYGCKQYVFTDTMREA